MARPIILGVVGDSGTGKSTVTTGLIEILGRDNVTRITMADYHKYDRGERSELGITALHPDSNYLDIMAQHIRQLRNGEPILKPVYRHEDGTFGRPEYVAPKSFVVIEGLLGYYSNELSSLFDVRVYLAPPEELRRGWKTKRDHTRRGYSAEQALRQLTLSELDSEAFVRPQEQRADLVVSFRPGALGDPAHLDAVLTLREGLPHPDLSVLVGDDLGDGITLEERGRERCLFIPGDVDRARGAAIEEAIWQRMHFASHLRTERLGVFSIGTVAHRSESLAIVQVLILYHLATAKAIVALGGDQATTRPGWTPKSVPASPARAVQAPAAAVAPAQA